MSEEAIFLNSGPLFSGERLEAMEDLAEWTEIEDEARVAYDRIREAFEKHSTLLAGSPSLDETRFFMVNPALHALGFTHSVYERVPTSGGTVVRVDYVMFPNAETFAEVAENRGSVAFYREALALGKGVRWTGDLDSPVPIHTPKRRHDDDDDENGDDLDATEENEVATQEEPEIDENTPTILPAAELDVLLRETGVDYGILTNGWQWRIYHRATSERLDTFFQADLISAIKTDFEDFKRFYLLFRRGAFIKGDQGTSFIDTMLQ